MTERLTTLDRLRKGQIARIVDIYGGHGIRQRLAHMGMYPGDQLEVLQIGLFGGPVLIRVNGVELAIGRGMARKIAVEVQRE
jgi:ferrous iron transport protein A